MTREEISGMEIDAKVERIQKIDPAGPDARGRGADARGRTASWPAAQPARRPSGASPVGPPGGSVFLLDRKVPVNVPRVRDRFRGTEVPLPLYRSLPSPCGADEGLRVLRGISCRSYRAAAIPEALGLSPSTVSGRFVRVSSRKLAEPMERDLSRARPRRAGAREETGVHAQSLLK